MHERITFTFDSLAFLCVSAKILPEFWQDAKLIFAGTMHLIDPIYTLNQWIIYSATTFLESRRKVVREIWFEKSGSRNLVGEKRLTRKKGGFIP